MTPCVCSLQTFSIDVSNGSIMPKVFLFLSLLGKNFLEELLASLFAAAQPPLLQYELYNERIYFLIFSKPKIASLTTAFKSSSS